MKKQLFLTMILMLAVSLISLNAQPDRRKEGHQRPAGPPPEIKKYIRENIIPVLKIQRQELDKELSKQEIARIDEIRTELKSLREQQRANRKEFEQSETKPTVDQRKQMRENRNKMNALMDEVEIMAENHDARITALLNEIQPEIEKAHHEMRKMMEQDCSPGHDHKHPQQPETPMMPPGHEGPHGSPLHRLLTPEGFLLFNPGEAGPGEDDFFSKNKAPEINVFPNPAGTEVQISLMLDNNSKVEINIYDKDGTMVENLPEEKASAGLFSKTIKLADFKNGLYFVKIRAGNKESIERIFIER
jgi:hypothetical protein